MVDMILLPPHPTPPPPYVPTQILRRKLLQMAFNLKICEGFLPQEFPAIQYMAILRRA